MESVEFQKARHLLPFLFDRRDSTLSPANLNSWGSYSDAGIKSARGFPALSAYATGDAYQRLVTREEIQGLLLAKGVGLTSIAVAVLGGEAAISWAGHAYLLLLPVLRINGYLIDSCGKRSQWPS